MGKPDPVRFAKDVTRAAKDDAPSREIRRFTTPKRTWRDKRTRPEHLWIPDTQVKAGVPIEHVRWAAQYAIDRRPDVIGFGNDWFDYPSLNNYELDFAGFRTRDFASDTLSGLHALDLFRSTLATAKDYDPFLFFVEGNHDERFRRQFKYDARMRSSLRGPRSFVRECFPKAVWVPYGEIVQVDGIHYTHAFFNPATSKPYGGSAVYKLTKLKFSYTQGHCQGKDTAEQFLVNGQVIRGLVAGSFYQHDEDYRGTSGNLAHWRGMIYKHEVRDGNYDLLEVSMDYLRRAYGGERVVADGAWRADEFTFGEDDES